MPDENNKQHPPSTTPPQPGGAEPVSSYPDEHPDDYHHQHYGGESAVQDSPVALVPAASPAAPPPPPEPPKVEEEEDDDDDGMLRMSFLEHLEELRTRLIRALIGLAVAFGLAMAFAPRIWRIVQEPAAAALTELGFPPNLVFTSPMEAFMIVWFKMPLLVSVFLASPWVLYQTWAFISPGLYKKERKLAAPFVLSTAGLFIVGGLFAYYIAFRFGLAFLLGVGKDINIQPMITVTEYTDIFVNVILGVGVVFEMPVLIFMLTLLRITTPTFLLNHSRYAILIIVIIAAVITPTPDVFNLMLFSVPMVVLYFVGIFASYLLVLNREGRAFPWGKVLAVFFLVLAILAATMWFLLPRLGYHFVSQWPYVIK
ncbi:MAG: twin-arginine translocase subunit TatC [Bryobacteraceae bacterium]|nr:twin-arginine translocase subunit TatC [Bryobacteraceae bacterium]